MLIIMNPTTKTIKLGPVDLNNGNASNWAKQNLVPGAVWMNEREENTTNGHQRTYGVGWMTSNLREQSNQKQIPFPISDDLAVPGVKVEVKLVDDITLAVKFYNDTQPLRYYLVALTSENDNNNNANISIINEGEYLKYTNCPVFTETRKYNSTYPGPVMQLKVITPIPTNPFLGVNIKKGEIVTNGIALWLQAQSTSDEISNSANSESHVFVECPMGSDNGNGENLDSIYLRR